jgi:hypothetical protein
MPNTIYTASVILNVDDIEPDGGIGEVTYTAPVGWFIVSGGIKGIADNSSDITVLNCFSTGQAFTGTVLNSGATAESRVRFQLLLVGTNGANISHVSLA